VRVPNDLGDRPDVLRPERPKDDLLPGQRGFGREVGPCRLICHPPILVAQRRVPQSAFRCRTSLTHPWTIVEADD
jgi:hypothetical protein